MIPINADLAPGLVTLRIVILFAILYVLAVILTFEFVNKGFRRVFIIAGFFVSAVLAALLERVI